MTKREFLKRVHLKLSYLASFSSTLEVNLQKEKEDVLTKCFYQPRSCFCFSTKILAWQPRHMKTAKTKAWQTNVFTAVFNGFARFHLSRIFFKNRLAISSQGDGIVKKKFALNMKDCADYQTRVEWMFTRFEEISFHLLLLSDPMNFSLFRGGD